jgi:transcriptional regulator with XRE-family HTH domain
MCNIPINEYKIYIYRNKNAKGGKKMTLDKINIGNRIRKIREELYHETRQTFAERCGLSENHLGKLERGELLVSINTLNKICSASGANSDYILYGNPENKELSIRQTIENFLDNSSKNELKMYFKFISTIKGYISSEK